MTKSLVKQRPIPRVISVSMSLVAVAAWLLASNHCVVAGLLPKPALASSGHEHCPAQDAPAEDGKGNDCSGLNCCKSLSAPATAFAKNVLGDDAHAFIAKDYPAIECSFPSEQHDAPISELDTGPPHADSFAESVLQRSLLAHAPPLA